MTDESVAVARTWSSRALIGAIMIAIILLGRSYRRDQHEQVLLDAAQTGDTIRAAAALRAGASPDVRAADQLTPLMIAARAGNTHVVRMLIDNGADLEHAVGGYGTALTMAATNDRLNAVRLLIARGADAGWRDHHGNTILHYAAVGASREVHEALLGAGADPRALSNNDESALDRAIDSGNSDAVDAIRVHLAG